MSENFAQVIELEKQLLLPAVRGQKAKLLELIAPDFYEIGASGKRYSFDDIMEMLVNEDVDVIFSRDFKAKELAEKLILLQYQTGRSEDFSDAVWRSSLWQLRGAKWQIIFHQGTKAAQ